MSSSYLTLPYLSQRGAIQSASSLLLVAYGRSSPSKGVSSSIASSTIVSHHFCRPRRYIADELEQYLSKKVPDFSLPVKKKPRQDKLVLGTR